MTPELVQAMTKTVNLFKNRDRSEDWSRNIIEGSSGITSERDWTLYYAFLTNPANFSESNVCLETINPNETIPLPEGLEEVVHKNGPDYIVEVKRINDDDEKIET